MIKLEALRLESNHHLEAKLWEVPDSKKAIVIAHSWKGSMEDPACNDAAMAFSQKRYTVLSFNFLGHGKSEGKLRDVSYRTISENVSDVIHYLKSKGYNKIGAYGLSLGTAAIALSKEKPNAQALLSPDSLYLPKELLERYSEEIKNLEGKDYITAISKSTRKEIEIGKEWIDEMRNDCGEIQEEYQNSRVPTLIIQGTADPNGKYGPRFVKKFGGESFEIKGADHEFNDPALRKIAIDKAIEFFNKNL